MATALAQTELISGTVDKVRRYGWKSEGKPGELRYVEKDLLNVDERYQRPANHALALRIASRWSYMSCGAITVALRQDGTLWAVDGQHRVLGARRRSDVKTLPCVIFKSASVEEEARAFLTLNAGKPVPAIDKHNAAVTSRDETALFIQALLESLGLSLARSARHVGQLAFIALCYRRAVENRADFETVLRFSAEICRYENSPISERLFDGLWYLQKAIKDGLGNARLARRIREIGTSRLLDGALRAAAFYSKGGAKVWATGMLQEINKNLRAKFEFEAVST